MRKLCKRIKEDQGDIFRQLFVRALRRSEECMALQRLIISRDGTRLWGLEWHHQSCPCLHQALASPLTSNVTVLHNSLTLSAFCSCTRWTLKTQPEDEKFPLEVNATFMSHWIGVIYFSGLHLVWRESLPGICFLLIHLFKREIKGDGSE